MSDADEIERLRHERDVYQQSANFYIEQAQKAEAENEWLREALNAIDDMCPVTCDMTLAHDMVEIARQALSKDTQ